MCAYSSYPVKLERSLQKPVVHICASSSYPVPGGTVGYPAQPGLTWRNQFLSGYPAQTGLICSSVCNSVCE
jgi:hypothetical protein